MATPSFELLPARFFTGDLCTCLQPQDRISLLSLNRDLGNHMDFTEIIADATDKLSCLRTHLSDVRKFGKNEFERLEKVLCLTEHPKVKDVLADQEERRHVFIGELGILVGELNLRTDRSTLRRMDLKVWFAAMRANRELAPNFFKVLCKWPVTYADRDTFLQQLDGASLLVLANCDVRESILWACKFASKFAGGSAEGVACTERYRFSAKAAKALDCYPQDDDVVVAALEYLSNVSNCPEHRVMLREELRIEIMCDRVVKRHPRHDQVEEFVLDIMATVRHGTI